MSNSFTILKIEKISETGNNIYKQKKNISMYYLKERQYIKSLALY